MSEPENHATKAPARFSPAALELLERLDNFAHLIVAVLLILMAVTVLAHTCVIFVKQATDISVLHHVIAKPAHGAPPATTVAHTDKPGGLHEPATANSETPHRLPEAEHEEDSEGSLFATDPFFGESLELLSSILFAVIILELLRTIITYLQTHDIHAIMQEFLVVGIISSVRKILLIGAESSLSASKGAEFVEEASGTVLMIVGILLLIVGLVLLRRMVAREGPNTPSHSTPTSE